MKVPSIALSLFSRMDNLSIPAGLALPPDHIPQDFSNCQTGYKLPSSEAATTTNCANAIRSMPSGFERVRWSTGPGSSPEQHSLPMTRTSGK